MTLIDRPLTELLDEFRKPTPTPGGGSAAALAGAVGASLLAMVASLPKPQASQAADLERLRAIAAAASGRSAELAALVDRDTQAYDAVTTAYRLPKETDADKQARSARIQAGLKEATEAPLAVMRACRDGLRDAPAVAELGNRSASSDLRVGIELLRAGLQGARYNVEVNLDTLKDPGYVASVRQEAGDLVVEAERLAADAAARLGLG